MPSEVTQHESGVTILFPVSKIALQTVFVGALAIADGGRAHFAVEECGDTLGSEATRIRSSHIRMKVADTSSAASRFALHALLSIPTIHRLK